MKHHSHRRSSRPLVAALALVVCLLGVSLPDRADASVCFGTGVLLPAASVAGTALLGIPGFSAPETRADLGVGTGTAGLHWNTSVRGHWEKFGYEIETFGVQPGGACLFSPWWNASASLSARLVDDDAHELRVLGGMGANTATGLTGVNFSLGLKYLVAFASVLEFGAEVRYLPVFPTASARTDHYESRNAAPVLANQFLASTRLQLAIVPGFQPFLRATAGAAGPFLGPDDDAATDFFISGMLGFQARWGESVGSQSDSESTARR